MCRPEYASTNDIDTKEDLALSRLQLALNVSDLDEAIDLLLQVLPTPLPGKGSIRATRTSRSTSRPSSSCSWRVGRPRRHEVNHLGVEVFSTR